MNLSQEQLEFMQNEALERFLRYVKINTQSNEDSETQPSTKCQLELGKLLKEELLALGLEDVELDEHGYVYATIWASEGYENVQPIGLIAHMDTSPAAPGEDVKPLIREYKGEPLTFPDDPELTLTEIDSPELKEYIGKKIITASGLTLLGADDKAGIAEIMGAIATLIKFPELKHGKIVVCFTPDEEIGRGTDKIKKERLPEYCYTIDGGEMGELEIECFDAWKAEIEFIGLNVHPGYAKNKMINAIAIATRFLAQMPEYETPEHTEGREGFWHLYQLAGNEEKAQATLILRDFEESKNKERIEYLEKLKVAFEQRYKGLRINLKTTHSYQNMKVFLEPHKSVIEKAEEAIKAAGLEVKYTAIRGGTDGARLSAEGIPTPNIFAGGLLFHSRKEYIPVEALYKGAEVILHLINKWAEK
ncbi:MAG: peptidase T [Candidatus Heimdallarchaeaceae archaeon]